MYSSDDRSRLEATGVVRFLDLWLTLDPADGRSAIEQSYVAQAEAGLGRGPVGLERSPGGTEWLDPDSGNS